MASETLGALVGERYDRHDVLVVARNLRTLRLRHGLTQGELAERLGVLPAQVSKWESGTHRPSDASLGKYTDFFDVSPDAIRGITATGADLGGRTATPVPIVDSVALGADGSLECHETGEHGPVPHSIAGRHPRSFLFLVTDDDMSMLFSQGCLVLIDPETPMAPGSHVGLVSFQGGPAALRRALVSPAGIALTTEPVSGAPVRKLTPPSHASDVCWYGRAVWDTTLSERDY